MITYPQFDTVRESLNDLAARAGYTDDGVAKILTDFEIKGVRHSTSFCAVAQWIYNTVRGFADGRMEGLTVFPSQGLLSAAMWTEYDAARTICMIDCGTSLPDSVNRFAIQFDIGEWPELIAETHPLDTTIGAP